MSKKDAANEKEQKKLEKEKIKKKKEQLKMKVTPKSAGEIHITIVGDQHTSKTTLLKNFAKDGNEYQGLFEYIAFQIKIGSSNDKKVLKLFGKCFHGLLGTHISHITLAKKLILYLKKNRY